jgi:hypothetical protein
MSFLSSAAQDHLELEALEEHAAAPGFALWHLPHGSNIHGFKLWIASADQAVCPARTCGALRLRGFHLTSTQGRTLQASGGFVVDPRSKKARRMGGLF